MIHLLLVVLKWNWLFDYWKDLECYWNNTVLLLWRHKISIIFRAFLENMNFTEKRKIQNLNFLTVVLSILLNKLLWVCPKGQVRNVQIFYAVSSHFQDYEMKNYCSHPSGKKRTLWTIDISKNAFLSFIYLRYHKMYILSFIQ